MLRAAILTKKLSPGERLPSQADLAKRYGVARMTIQQSLRILRDENLIVSRQGSGVYVRERTARPVGLRPHIEAAFTADEVRIDFSGYTAETLATAISEPIDKIRDGRLTPRSIELRLLLSDMTRPIALPSRAGDDPGDDPRLRDRMAKTAERYAGGITESLAELEQARPRRDRTRSGARALLRAAVQDLPAQHPRTVLRVLPGRRAHHHRRRRSGSPPTTPWAKTPPCSTTPPTTTLTACPASTSPRPSPGSTASGPPSPDRSSYERARRAALQRLGEIVDSTWPVLLDFDGPVTHYFVNGRNQRLADQLRDVLDRHDVEVPEAYRHLRPAYRPSLGRPAHTHSRSARRSTPPASKASTSALKKPSQLRARPTCWPPVVESGRPVVIVSNNADGPIHAFLNRYQLEHLVDAVIGRTPNRPDLMKPHPHLVEQALRLLANPPTDASSSATP